MEQKAREIYAQYRIRVNLVQGTELYYRYEEADDVF